jgi:hypothetical protein
MGNASNAIGGAPVALTHGGHGGGAPNGTSWLVGGHWRTDG